MAASAGGDIAKKFYHDVFQDLSRYGGVRWLSFFLPQAHLGVSHILMIYRQISVSELARELPLLLSSPLDVPRCPQVVVRATFECPRNSESSDSICFFQVGFYQVPRTFERSTAKESL